MNERAKQQVESMLADGIKLAPQDIVLLHDLAQACIEKDGDMEAAPRVAWAGDTPIYQNTIQSDKWFNDYALLWWSGASRFAALAWACAHARERGFFAACTDEQKTRKWIETWAAGLNCTESELVWAVGYVTGTGSAESETDERTAINGCPYTRIIHDCIAAGLGISVDDLQALTFHQAVDILTRWARNQIAMNGGDIGGTKQRINTSANIKFLEAVERLRGRKWRKTASIYA